MITELIDQIMNSEEDIIPSNFHRISEGVYQFGTRKIHAAILSGSLVVRVGGGYMKFVDFVKKYGKFESIKIVKADSSLGQQTMLRTSGTYKMASSPKKP